jgi:hypothetical protein
METFIDKLTSVNLDKELYMQFGKKLSKDEYDALESLIDKFCYDYVVSVSCKMFYSHQFVDTNLPSNEIRVTGTLEKLFMAQKTPEGFDNQYRIIVDASNYVYFSIENVSEFGTMGMGCTFGGGQHLVLSLIF